MSKDGIIIGAGPGGLASAIVLAAAGVKVKVLERMQIVGGRTSSIEAEGFKFDLGPTFFLYPRVLEEIRHRGHVAPRRGGNGAARSAISHHLWRGRRDSRDAGYRAHRKIARKKFSCSTFMMYLGVEGEFDLPHHNIHIAGDYPRNLDEIENQHVLSDDPSFYVQNACVTDPTLAPRGMSALYVLAPVTHQHPNAASARHLRARRDPMVRLYRLSPAASRRSERALVFSRPRAMRLPLFALILLKAAIAEPVEKLNDFEPTDQHAKTRSYRFPKAKVTVMTVADHRGSAQLAPWIQTLHDRYRKRIDIDGVADVSMIPKLFHGMFREAFRKKLTYSVMLDWEGSVVKEFGYTKGVANIYVIDRCGRIVQQVTGPMREAAARELFDEIDRVLKHNVISNCVL